MRRKPGGVKTGRMPLSTLLRSSHPLYPMPSGDARWAAVRVPYGLLLLLRVLYNVLGSCCRKGRNETGKSQRERISAPSVGQHSHPPGALQPYLRGLSAATWWVLACALTACNPDETWSAWPQAPWLPPTDRGLRSKATSPRSSPPVRSLHPVSLGRGRCMKTLII